MVHLTCMSLIYLNLKLGFYINLFLKTKVNINIILPRKASQDQFLPERYKLTLKNQKIAEVKGDIKEVEVFPGQSLEWWFVPVKTGVFNDLFCNVKDKKTNLTHSEMGMTGTIKIY